MVGAVRQLNASDRTHLLPLALVEPVDAFAMHVAQYTRTLSM